MQHPRIAYSSLPRAQLVQPAALTAPATKMLHIFTGGESSTAHCAHNALQAFIPDFVVGKQEDGQAAGAGGQPLQPLFRSDVYLQEPEESVSFTRSAVSPVSSLSVKSRYLRGGRIGEGVIRCNIAAE